jgi:hypothetical protein
MMAGGNPFKAYLATQAVDRYVLPRAEFWTLDRVTATLRQPFCNWVSGCESAVRSLDKKIYYDIDPPYLPIEAAISLGVRGSLPKNTIDPDSIAIFEESLKAIEWCQFAIANHESIPYADRLRILSFPEWDGEKPGHWWSVMKILERIILQQQAEADLD